MRSKSRKLVAGLFCTGWPRALLVVGTVALITTSRGQSPPGSDLYRAIAERDGRLFEQGFNGHDIAPFEELISDSFEFYHDTAGITPSKAAFLSDLQKGLFALSYRARRELVPGTLQVFPLEKNGALYGALETGEHRFLLESLLRARSSVSQGKRAENRRNRRPCRITIEWRQKMND